MIPHPLGIAGVTLGAMAAWGMSRFPRDPDADSPLSREQLASLRAGSSEMRRAHVMQLLPFRFCVAALVLSALMLVADYLFG